MMRGALSRRAWLAAAALVLGSEVGCVRGSSEGPKLPPPVHSTALGPGDVFELVIVGEKDLPTEYQVATDGTVNLPYIHRVKVEGLERQDVEELVAQLLRDKKILTNPSVVVKVKEYASKQVTLLGEVKKPGAFPLTPGLTLIQAISRAGGLSSIAYRGGVVLTRVLPGGKSKTVSVDVDAITSGDQPDLLLQAGDRIFVRQRVF